MDGETTSEITWSDIKKNKGSFVTANSITVSIFFLVIRVTGALGAF